MRRIQMLASWMLAYRFFLLSISILGIMCLHTISGEWTGDFWEHSAVVRELMTHILHPKHPQLLLDSSHAFYSPYSVVVAFVACMLQFDTITALSVVGMLNLSLLLFGINFFIFSIVPEHKNETAFYVLLFTLFYWGASPWFWSGFFHIGVLGYVLPYPSTFSAALTLIALGGNQHRIEGKRHIWLIPIFCIAIVVLISHPTTFLFLAAGLVSQSCIKNSFFLSSL